MGSKKYINIIVPTYMNYEGEIQYSNANNNKSLCFRYTKKNILKKI